VDYLGAHRGDREHDLFDAAEISMQPALISPFIFSTEGELEKKWAYLLRQNAQFRIKGRNFPPREIWVGNTLIGEVRGEILTIFAGYAWNGMSCWGDSPTNILASIYHDFWYQVGAILTRKEADQGLRFLLQTKHDPAAFACYYAVRICGRMFYGREKGVRLVSI